MYGHSCAICSAEFTGRRRKFCTPACAKESDRRKSGARRYIVAGRPVPPQFLDWWVKADWSPVDPKFCAACFDPLPLGRPGPPARFCSHSCYVWRRDNPGTASRPDSATNCAECGRPMPDRMRHAKYCSEWCTAWAYGARFGLPERPKTCAECGAEFTPGNRLSARRFCGIKCKRKDGKRRARAEGRQWRQPWNDSRRDAYQRRRALKKGTAVGDRPVIRDEIAARDKYRCGICGGRVNMATKYPHPKSPSLDHIIPLQPSDGSEPGTHTPENVQLAHLLCNTSKGNRGTGDQLLLIG